MKQDSKLIIKIIKHCPNDSALSKRKTRDEIPGFKKFQATFDKKFLKLEEAITSNSSFGRETRHPRNIDAMDNFKEITKHLGNELSKRDEIIDYLTKQLLSSKSNNCKNSDIICAVADESLNKGNKNEHFNTDTISKDSNKNNYVAKLNKIKVVIISGSMFNGIQEKEFTKNHSVKLKSGTTLENVDELVFSEPDCLVVYIDTNDRTSKINFLGNT